MELLRSVTEMMIGLRRLEQANQLLNVIDGFEISHRGDHFVGLFRRDR